MCATLIGMFPAGPADSATDHQRVITTPLLLMDLLLTAALPWPTVLFTLVVDEIMIITGLVGALVVSSYKVSVKPLGRISPGLIISVGLLRIWQPSSLRRGLDFDLDSSQARRRSWRRRWQSLQYLRSSHGVPLVLVPHRLGSLRGRQSHLARR